MNKETEGPPIVGSSCPLTARIASRSGLEIQPSSVHPPKKTILGIDLVPLRAKVTGLPVGMRKDNLTNQLLDRPSVFDELQCKVVQQSRVTGRITTGAEITWRANHPRPEKMPPDSVYDHTSRQGVLGVGDRFGHLQSAAAPLERLPALACENLQELPRDL